MSSSTLTGASPMLYPDYFNHNPLSKQNPHLLLTHDIVRNTKTLHFEINTSKALGPSREYQKSMRGYFGVLSLSACRSCDLYGNGDKVCLEDEHCLCQSSNTTEIKDGPLWHLRVSVLKDEEARGDGHSCRFAFKSLQHLIHAANQLDAAFKLFNIKKCGVESPNAMLNDGQSANTIIEGESVSTPESWKEFLARLKRLEDEWEHEGMSVL